MMICDKLNYVPISLEWSALSGGISHFKCFWHYFLIISSRRVTGGLLRAYYPEDEEQWLLLLYSIHFKHLRFFKKSHKLNLTRLRAWALTLSRNNSDSTNEGRDGAVSSSCPRHLPFCPPNTRPALDCNCKNISVYFNAVVGSHRWCLLHLYSLDDSKEKKFKLDLLSAGTYRSYGSPLRGKFHLSSPTII